VQAVCGYLVRPEWISFDYIFSRFLDLFRYLELFGRFIKNPRSLKPNFIMENILASQVQPYLIE